MKKFLLITLIIILFSTISFASETTFEPLKGRWIRLDGNYGLQIINVEPSKKIEAAYFNPRPINVSEAQAKEKEGKLEVFVKLEDRGYPGSTYTLTYDPKRDELQGTYFHAGLKRNYQVTFVRFK